MKLPVIKNISEFIKDNDEDYVIEALEVLEHMAVGKGLKDEEIEVVAELISNLYGAIEVQKLVKQGVDQKEALNTFMKRVMGSIDR